MHWYTTFGKVEVFEQIFLRESKIYRPFAQKFRVHCRYYSRPLQRAITDFGADVSFGQAMEKMKEHYGLEVSACMIRKITEAHARKITQVKPPESIESELVIAEIDGSMVPIVEMKEREGIDLRKTRKVCWKEAKLCFARANGQVDRVYAAVIGTPEEAGKNLFECVKRAGLKEETYVHVLGDGAQWIADQVENQFGTQAHFLIDFFHMCEYLAEAVPWCADLDSKKSLEEKKEMMKTGESEKVFCKLKMQLEQLEDAPKDNGLARCVCYMEKRLKYMNYGEAKQKELPIGSGEIESSHRHVVQKRLKIAGAWWKRENANAMLQLRTARANGYWKDYWNEQKAA